MFVVREVPKELKYRNRSPRRAPRIPRNDPAKRSLVNCNHLALSDTRLPNLTAAEWLEEKVKAERYLVAKKHIHAQIHHSIGVVCMHDFNRNRFLTDEEVTDLAERAPKRQWSAARDYRRLGSCQREWIGYKPSCCGSKAVAVPIGCNHRLCPLCNAARLERYRAPGREMLAAMENPVFLTLTIPNDRRLTRGTFDQIRKWWKAFFRANKGFLRGGIYSIEATYNRETQTWHPHLHIVFDAPFPMRGMQPKVFGTLKRRLEFSWLRVTSAEAQKQWGAKDFELWEIETKRRDRGCDWNREFRRVVDLKAVSGDVSAVYELIKYISKTNRFLDLPPVVATFLRAVYGVRVLQRFGTFYNFKGFDEADEAVEKGELPTGENSFYRCECGQNIFKRIGVFSMADVVMEENGRWTIRPSCERRRCRGSSTYEVELEA
jgi:hypothetical protein